MVRKTNGGKFEARFFDSNGRDRQVTKAQRHLAELEAIARSGPRSQPDFATYSPEAFLHVFIREFQAGGGAQSDPNLSAAQKWILPHINELEVAAVTVQHIRDMLAAWRLAGQSEASCRQLSYITDWIFDAAWRKGAVGRNVSRDYFSRANHRPRAPRPEPQMLPDEDDIAALRVVVRDRPFLKAVLETVLNTRPNTRELQALCLSDIENGHVRYRFLAENGYVVEQPNLHNDRSVPLGSAEAAISEWLAARLEMGWADSPFVFAKSDGEMRSDVFRYHLKKMQFDAGLPAHGTQPGKTVECFQPRYSMEQLGNHAVGTWLEQGKRGLELSTLIGCTDDGMARFSLMIAAADGMRVR